jgi:hypothetical protein
MPIFRGNNQISKIFRGTTEIVKVFRGEDLIFQLGGDVYELIADVDVTTATTQIDFDNLNITKDDELRMVYTFVGESTNISQYNIRSNDITSNYTFQELYGFGSTIAAGRQSGSIFAIGRSDRKTAGFIDVKVSNNDRFVAQSQYMFAIGSSSSNMEHVNSNIVNTSTVTSITKLSVVSTRTNGIAVGSRLQLYKVNKGSA